MRDSTRLRILLAAEQLFAERGLDGASLREIGAAAGQRNNSAVQYHFGDRDALVRALYELRLEPLNLRRTELVDVLVREGRESDLVALVDAYARPLFEVADGSSWYARFVARHVGLGSTVELDPPLDARYTSALHTVTDLLRRATAPLPAALRTERTRRMQLYVTAAIADVETRRARGEPLAVGADASLRDLVATAAVMLAVEAPVRPTRATR
jgi:AcrR family transcriptional regulator